jgi:hypothetical protein
MHTKRERGKKSKGQRNYIQQARLTSICHHVFEWFHLHLHEPEFLQPAYKGAPAFILLNIEC